MRVAPVEKWPWQATSDFERWNLYACFYSKVMFPRALQTHPSCTSSHLVPPVNGYYEIWKNSTWNGHMCRCISYNQVIVFTGVPLSFVHNNTKDVGFKNLLLTVEKFQTTTWDGAKTLYRMEYLPYQLVQDFFHSHGSCKLFPNERNLITFHSV